MAKKKRPEEPESTQNNDVTGNNNKNFVDIIWGFLSSMKLGIILLLVLAAVSIIGTVWVPTDEYGQPDYLKFYNNPIFNLLLGLLALNLLICSLNRWKVITGTFKGPKADFADGLVKNMNSVKSLKTKKSPAEMAAEIKDVLKKKGYRVFTAGEGDKLKIAADKGHWGIVGPYLTHLSFFVMILAMMVKFSGLVGFDGSMAGMVGETVNLSEVRGIQNVDSSEYFDVKINDFRTEYRPDGTVKQWYSDVTVIDKNNTFDYTIYVNRPLVYKGIKFYQSGYGTSFSGKVSGPVAKDQSFSVGTQDYIRPPGTYLTIIPLDYNSETKEIFIRTFQGQDFVDQKWLKIGDAYSYEQGTVKFEAATPYTVLSVKRDPGVPVIGVGSLIFLVGMFVSFIMRQRRVWALVAAETGGTTVYLGGTSAKDKRGLDIDLDSITAGLKE